MSIALCFNAALRRLLILGCVLCMSVAAAAAQSSGIRYIYDALGRLIAVIDHNGDAAIYSYDAVGNLLSITRRSAGDVQIATFTPVSGPVGSAVTIVGVGFSEIAFENAVSFNGMAAQVTLAAPTQLVVTVPAGATTGPISVVTSIGASTSATPFTVTADVTPPTITAFTPTIGLSGTEVEVTGTGFDVSSAQNRLTFNGPRAAAVSNATASEIQTSVPASSTSGRLTLRTSAGTAASDGDFFVPPPPYTPADVDVATRVTFGQQEPVSLTDPAHIGLLLFDGAPGRRVSIHLGDVNHPPNADYAVLHPLGSPLAFSWTDWNFIDPFSVPTPGTYTLMLGPVNWGDTDLEVTVYDVPPDVSSPLSIEGPSVTLAVATPGQNAKALLEGTAGQHIGLQLSDISVPALHWGIRRTSDGQNVSAGDDWTSADDPPEEQFLDVVLPESGTYAVWFDPEGAGIGEITVTASEVPPDVVGSISPGGPPVTVETAFAGQNARLTFSGQAGQRIAMSWQNNTPAAAIRVSVFGPNGALVFNPVVNASTENYRDTASLPVTGTYVVFIDPQDGDVGSITIQLYDVPSDATGTLTVGGPPHSLTLASGQNASLTFSGTAGQSIAIQASDVTIAWSAVGVWRPDGGLIDLRTFGTSGYTIVDITLPVTGTYVVTVDPERANSGSITLTLHEASEVIGAITPGGPPVTVTIAAPGQNARLLFQGTPGQKVSVRATNVTVNFTTLSILAPDGSPLASPTSADFIDTKVLPVAGTYTLFVNPLLEHTGSVTLTMYEVEDVTGGIAVSGSPVPVTITTPGQNASLTFSGTNGQRVGVRTTNVTMPGTVSLLGTGGGSLGSASLFPPDTLVDPVTLFEDGTYTVFVNPSYINTGGLTVILDEVPLDIVGSVTINGSGFTASITAPGQKARVTFSGTAGQQVTVRVTGNTAGSATVSLLRPSGSLLQSSTSSAASFNLPQRTLPTTGTYTILLDPLQGNVGSLTVSVTNP